MKNSGGINEKYNKKNYGNSYDFDINKHDWVQCISYRVKQRFI